MRTRFLNLDFFDLSSSSNEAISFPNLPVPHLPPPGLLPFQSKDLFLRFDSVSRNLPLEIQLLPIDAALEIFISNVIPQDVDYGGFERVDEIRFPERDNEAAGDDKRQTFKFDLIYFEEPEANVFLDNACIDKEGTRILSAIPEVENNPDLLSPGVEMHYTKEVQESLYSIEDITLPYDVDQNAYGLEDDGFIHENTCYGQTFSLLEVNESSLRIFTNPTMEDQLLLFLEDNKSRITEKDDRIIDGMELLGSVKYGVMEFLSNHCLSEQCLESQFVLQGTIMDADIVSVVEILHSNDDSTDCILPINPVTFEEFELHALDIPQSYEVFFEKKTRYEPETCPGMFGEDVNFKDFNELIVSCELAAIEDDTFRSLPIPILVDNNKIRSLYSVAEQTLSELKPLSLSATDKIYLDWHLLEEDKYNCKIYSYQNMLRELHTQSINYDCGSWDDGNLVIDFILSDNVLNCPKMEEYKVSLNSLHEGTSDDQPKGVASSKSLEDKYPKLGNGECFAEENAGKTSLPLKSIPLFNDLDFFLNPVKAIAGEKSESAVKAPDTKAKFLKEGDSNSILVPDEDMSDLKFEKMLNSIEDDYNMGTPKADDKVDACYMHIPVPDSCSKKSEQAQGGMGSSSETIIIVNTQDFDIEMIVSRRSTYQKILALEKNGTQVVERDLDIPVDVMINSATCLVWYNCQNIGKKATAAYEASSCLPLCIENIATNVLTLLSFSFSGCILVFEGEVNFLSSVLDSSDELYAAAASLGIKFQLFCSSSCDLTDDIILSSILNVNNMCRGIYPRMPESETLAESFLTKFPSVNPLTAHAIISSGITLMEFFGWSHEQRILAIQEYHVPVESVALFSTLCKYGEREDSKSIMTDCSSSVSSGPDSNKSHVNVDSPRKRRRCIIQRPQNVDVQVDDDILQFERPNQFPDGIKGPSGVPKPFDCWLSADSEILDEPKRPSSNLKDSFRQKQGVEDAWMMDSSYVFKPYDYQNTKCPLELDETIIHFNDKLFTRNQGSEIASKNELDWSNASKSENLHEDFVGEVIDLIDNSNVSESKYLSPWPPKTEQDSARKTKAARRLSFGNNSYFSFPEVGGLNSDSDFWTSSNVKNHRQNFRVNKNILSDSVVNYNEVPLKHPRKLFEEGLAPRSAGNSKDFPFKEEVSYYSGTPLSRAIHSGHPQPGSPWTIEFLNRIREKSRLRQQSLQCDTSILDFGCSGNISKVHTRKSPSMIQFFKYQGGSKPEKVNEQKKKKKQSMQFSGPSKNEKPSASLPTWTPVDKRSRQTLSFAINGGSGSQTRLVWSDGSAHHLSKKLRTNN